MNEGLVNFYSTLGESLSKKSSSNRGIFSLEGKSSCGSTRNALARHSSSKSETQRRCVSIFASVCRLKSQPHRRQRAANIGCVNFCWSRKRRICKPTRFRGFFFMFRIRNRNGRKCSASKGSEFRTLISLDSKWERVKQKPIRQSEVKNYEKNNRKPSHIGIYCRGLAPCARCSPNRHVLAAILFV